MMFIQIIYIRVLSTQVLSRDCLHLPHQFWMMFKRSIPSCISNAEIESTRDTRNSVYLSICMSVLPILSRFRNNRLLLSTSVT